MGCELPGGGCPRSSGYSTCELRSHCLGGCWNSAWLLRVVVQPWLKDCDSSIGLWRHFLFEPEYKRPAVTLCPPCLLLGYQSTAQKGKVQAWTSAPAGSLSLFLSSLSQGPSRALLAQAQFPDTNPIWPPVMNSYWGRGRNNVACEAKDTAVTWPEVP